MKVRIRMGRIILTSFDEKEKYWVSSFLVFQCAFAVLVIVGATVSADHAPQYLSLIHI